VEHVSEDRKRTVKAKVSTKFDFSLSVKYPSIVMPDYATIILGIHGSNLHNEKRDFKVGLQVDLDA